MWITRPEYYLDEYGNDSEYLDPDSEGWWTCHKDTQKGDLVLLYRSRIKRDIGCLMQAESGAYSIAEDDYASKQGWDYACDYRVLYKFEYPLTLEELRHYPYVQDWGAYKAGFRRRVYEIPVDHWKRLNQLAAEKNYSYQRFLKSIERTAISKSIILEEQLEEELFQNPGLLNPFGYNLQIYIDPVDGTIGRQLVCKGNGGRIDLLCYDSKRKRYVVIELKNVRASQNTFGQISNYIGWVQERIAGNAPVIGLVVSRGYDTKFQSSLRVTDRVFHLDLEQLGFK